MTRKSRRRQRSVAVLPERPRQSRRKTQEMRTKRAAKRLPRSELRDEKVSERSMTTRLRRHPKSEAERENVLTMTKLKVANKSTYFFDRGINCSIDERPAKRQKKRRKNGPVHGEPNKNIPLVETDPTFSHTSEDITKCCIQCSSREAIRAVLTKNTDLLKKLIEDKENVWSLEAQHAADIEYVMS
jgi:hypothetical protein